MFYLTLGHTQVFFLSCDSTSKLPSPSQTIGKLCQLQFYSYAIMAQLHMNYMNWPHTKLYFFLLKGMTMNKTFKLLLLNKVY